MWITKQNTVKGHDKPSMPKNIYISDLRNDTF